MVKTLVATSDGNEQSVPVVEDQLSSSATVGEVVPVIRHSCPSLPERARHLLAKVQDGDTGVLVLEHKSLKTEIQEAEILVDAAGHLIEFRVSNE